MDQSQRQVESWGQNPKHPMAHLYPLPLENDNDVFSKGFPPWGNVVSADIGMSLSIPGLPSSDSEGAGGTWPSSLRTGVV